MIISPIKVIVCVAVVRTFLKEKGDSSLIVATLSVSHSLDGATVTTISISIILFIIIKLYANFRGGLAASGHMTFTRLYDEVRP